jgi:hypothetical protein
VKPPGALGETNHEVTNWLCRSCLRQHEIRFWENCSVPPRSVPGSRSEPGTTTGSTVPLEQRVWAHWVAKQGGPGPHEAYVLVVIIIVIVVVAMPTIASVMIIVLSIVFSVPLMLLATKEPSNDISEPTAPSERALPATFSASVVLTTPNHSSENVS